MRRYILYGMVGIRKETEEAMTRIDEYTKNALERIKQLEHQRRMERHSEDKRKKEEDTRRYIIIGKLVCEYFPKLMKCQLRRSEAETKEEFSDLENILAYLAEHTEILEVAEKWARKCCMK